MIAIQDKTTGDKIIRIGDDLVQATTGKVEHTIYRIIRGTEYKFEVCAPIDKWTAEKIVKRIK
jgi:hypothetical protein